MPLCRPYLHNPPTTMPLASPWQQHLKIFSVHYASRFSYVVKHFFIMWAVASLIGAESRKKHWHSWHYEMWQCIQLFVKNICSQWSWNKMTNCRCGHIIPARSSVRAGKLEHQVHVQASPILVHILARFCASCADSFTYMGSNCLLLGWEMTSFCNYTTSTFRNIVL